MPSPFLLDDEPRGATHPDLRAETLDATWGLDEGLEAGMTKSVHAAAQAVDSGHPLLILTDRAVSAAARPSRRCSPPAPFTTT